MPRRTLACGSRDNNRRTPLPSALGACSFLGTQLGFYFLSPPFVHDPGGNDINTKGGSMRDVGDRSTAVAAATCPAPPTPFPLTRIAQMLLFSPSKPLMMTKTSLNALALAVTAASLRDTAPATSSLHLALPPALNFSPPTRLPATSKTLTTPCSNKAYQQSQGKERSHKRPQPQHTRQS